LIREDESAVGYDRNNVRTKAKIWLIDHGSSLAAADILLARDHFGYLLPMGWEAPEPDTACLSTSILSGTAKPGGL